MTARRSRAGARGTAATGTRVEAAARTGLARGEGASLAAAEEEGSAGSSSNFLGFKSPVRGKGG